MSAKNLLDLLDIATQNEDVRGIIGYSLEDCISKPVSLSYKSLKATALQSCLFLRKLEGFSPGCVILLHFNEHLDNIIWFWAVLYAGCIPALSTPVPHIDGQREKQLKRLHDILQDPICLTSSSLRNDFSTSPFIRIQTVKTVISESSTYLTESERTDAQSITYLDTDTAVLMLTSGSTGDAKAVSLSHKQLLTSIKGKASIRPVGNGFSCLNWIGLDHVAGLVEIHLLAIYLNVDQVHVQAEDLIPDPTRLLSLIDRHRVARTFAPNFFLARLQCELEIKSKDCFEKHGSIPLDPPASIVGRHISSDASGGSKHHKSFDLSCLTWLGSGGEANPVKICHLLVDQLMKFGAPRNVIVPGFGMTETCAGAIYNDESRDYVNGFEFLSVGKCVPGIQLRINQQTNHSNTVLCNQAGDLEIKGDIVFKEYFNNPVATTSAFTPDGWFKTGDRAIIDSSGMLNLVGRWKETMRINGVQYVPSELETTLGDAQIPGVTPGYIVCFSYRRHGAESQTEQICVVYLPSYESGDSGARVRALAGIVKTVMLRTSTRPYVLPLGDEILFPKSTLGKINRTKIYTAFMDGKYKHFDDYNQNAVAAYRAAHFEGPKDSLESLLLKQLVETLYMDGLSSFGVDTPILDMGITSIDLIKASHKIEQELKSSLGIPALRVPPMMIITNPTVRSLATAIRSIVHRAPSEYNPVVVLQQGGSRLPIWLFHPGVGEVLVFMSLAKFLTDRPVYAFRARGFEPGESYFDSIDESVSIYHAAMKEKQPQGPYVIAGYSYGSMLAFETAKLLEVTGDEVGFLGIFNLPPHIKFRMRQLNWQQCLLNLAFFLDLITEQKAEMLGAKMNTLSREEALRYVLDLSDQARLEELSLTTESVSNWVELAYSLQRMAVNYNPDGMVQRMDVFYCTPLSAVASSRSEWLEHYLKAWKDFCRTEPLFHEVNGSHYTMLDSDHVFNFQKTLKRVLWERSV